MATTRPRLVHCYTKHGEVVTGFIYRESVEGNGIELLVPIVDSQSNKVEWEHSSKARVGIDFVEIGSDPNVMREYIENLRVQQKEAGVDQTVLTDIFNTQDLQVEHTGEGKHKHIKG